LTTTLSLLCSPASAAAVDAAEGVIVNAPGFEVAGNTLLAPETIQARLAEFHSQPRNRQDREPDLPRLKAAAAAVQELYRRAGYGGVIAFLPEQTLKKDVVVRIRVVEGRLAHVEVKGNEHFSTANILASLPDLKPGETPRVRVIDEQIQLANESPVKTVQVLLQPGEGPGDINAQVSVRERPTQQFHVRLDNTGNASTGRWRSSLGWMDGDLLGGDQILGLELQLAPEHPSELVVASVSYRAPLYTRSMALDAYAAWYDVSAGTTATAAGDLDFAGRGYILGTRLNYYLPRLGNVDQRLLLGLEDRVYDNSCSISGLPAGACGSAGASVDVQPLTVQYLGQSAGLVVQNWGLGLSVNLGFLGGNADAASVQTVRPGARQHYGIFRGHYAATYTFTNNTGQESLGSVSLRAAAQYTSDALIPGEQFGLGGAQSVRGYAEREVSGDRGLQGTLEYLSAALFPTASAALAQLRALAFSDAGWADNRLGTPCAIGRSRCQLASAGAGLRYAYQDFQARLDWGHALRAGSLTRRGDNRIHVALSLAI
jgi:hemolysin activation/secretion protein